MKKIVVLLIGFSMLLMGCANGNKDVLNELKENINNLTSYNIKGELEIINNEDTYIYDVDVF